MLQSFLTVGQQIITLYLLLVVGFVLGKVKMLDDRASAAMSNLVMYVVSPCMMVVAFQRPLERTALHNFGVVTGVSVILHAVFILAAVLLIRDRNTERQSALRFAAVFTNCGFMGYPLMAALLGSLAGGVVLNRLAYLLLLKIVRFPVSYSPAVCVPALGSTALLMCFVFLLILAFNLFSVLRTKPIELLKSAQAGEQEPRTRWVLTLLGLVCLGSGYAIAILCKDPIAAILLFFLAALLVILGTYCLFTAGSVALLKALRRNKRYYY